MRTGITVEVHQLVGNFPEAQMLLRMLSDFQNAVGCKGYTSVLSKMVSVIFAVLEVLFLALTTVVKLPWKFLTLIPSKYYVSCNATHQQPLYKILTL